MAAGAVVSTGPGTQGPYYPGAPGLYQSPQPAGQPTPKGYTWDEVQKRYIPYAGSASYQQEEIQRQRAAQDAARAQQQALYGQLASTSLANIPPLSMGVPSAPPPPTFGPPPGASQVNIPGRERLDVPDMTAADEAIFARAKDRQGQIARSAITGLESTMAGRGMLGSGKERAGLRDIIQQGAGELGNLTREQAIQQAQQAQKNAELAYQGGISQRGQDIAAQQQQAQNALAAWRAQNEAQLGQYGASLDAFKTGLGAMQTQQQMALEAARARQNALTGLLSSIRY